MGTTIAVSDEIRWLLSRFKEGAGVRSMDEALRLLLEGGPHSVWHIMHGRRDALREVCRKHGVTRLTAFGSRVRGTAHDRSDLDLAFEAKGRVNLGVLFGLKDELERLLGVPVDLHTWNGLKPRLRRTIEEEGVELLA